MITIPYSLACSLSKLNDTQICSSPQRKKKLPIINHTTSPLSPRCESYTSEPEQAVPRLRRGGVAGAERLDLGLGFPAEVLGGVVGTADVGQLVADAVRDDVGVEGLLLVGRDLRVIGLEGELVGRTPVQAALELYGRVTGAEVDCGVVVVPAVVVVAVPIAVVAVVAVVTIVAIVGISVATAAVGATVAVSVSVVSISIAIISVVSITIAVVAIVTVTIVAIVAVAVVTVVTTAAYVGSRPVRTLSNKVGKAVGDGDIRLTEAIRIERIGQGSLRVGILNVRTNDGRVDKWNNATELRCCGEVGIGANGRNGNDEWVEVLLCSN